MKHTWLYILLIAFVILGLAFMFGVVSYVMSTGEEHSSFSFLKGGRIGVVKVEGAILSSDEAIEDIENVRKDGSVASVVLRIESPGGSVGASQEILEAVKMLAEEKPVVASMGSVAASGGYYVALGAKQILANPGTITGSIGVRMEHINVGGLLNWAKIGHETLKSGKFKDLGSFDRPLSPSDRELLEGVLANMHQQFKDAVAQARNLDMKDVDELADGRIYTGQEAINLGLVDRIGGFAEAIKLAAELGGIKGEPKLYYPRKTKMWFMRLVEEAKSTVEDLTRVSVEYWQPMMALRKGGQP
ncbi:MAG: signal peptide peptidase SppA [Pseudomonadota bacterium]